MEPPITHRVVHFSAGRKQRPPDAGQAWMMARLTIAAAQAGEEVDRYKPQAWKELGQVHYFGFENCPEQAFENATNTLRARAQEFGARSEAVKDWLEAQDAVVRVGECQQCRRLWLTILQLLQRMDPAADGNLWEQGVANGVPDQRRASSGEA